MRYKIILAYDGTQYSGWQVQTNAVSIQSLVQRALCTVLRAPTDLTGSGRTDAGVHARGQTAHFDSDLPLYRKNLKNQFLATSALPQNCDSHSRLAIRQCSLAPNHNFGEPPCPIPDSSGSFGMDLSKLRLALNGLLPVDIRILDIEPALPTFHARYSALSKTYHYYLHTDRIHDPFTRKYRWHVLKRLDLESLKEAAEQFVGRNDFTSFANEPNKGSAAKDPIRHLQRLEVHPVDGGIRLEFEADGFLYKMVRNIVGTLVECACGNLSPQAIPNILAAKDRRKAFAAAPPLGLFLMQVHYGK